MCHHESPRINEVLNRVQSLRYEKDSFIVKYFEKSVVEGDNSLETLDSLVQFMRIFVEEKDLRSFKSHY